jgi:UDP-N-acetyl-D-glucosamine dehydrogenase
MDLKAKIDTKQAVLGIVGLGYVGLPLLIEFARKGFAIIGLDIDQSKIEKLNAGKSYIKHIPGKDIEEINAMGKVSYTTDFARSPEADVILIALPTPLDEHREPDLSYIEDTSHELKKHLRPGQMFILESSTWPGTTDEVMRPILEQSGKKCNVDFYVAFSPEREDPNNQNFTMRTTPKVVGADDPYARECAIKLYGYVTTPVPVSSTRAAESAKLLENIFRSVNIALVNEMKQILDRMGIDVWEVIKAASTKPFGFMPFYPGPGLGGHCIPIDPFYLTWKAREFDMPTRFIELAGEINTNMPYYVFEKTLEAINEQGKSLKNAKVLILGAAYKKDIDDMRETPAFKVIEILHERGCKVDYHDPYIPKLPATRKYQYEMSSVPLTEENIKKFDVIIVITDHTDVDYDLVRKHAQLVIDTRNVFKIYGKLGDGNIVKA